MTVIAQTTHFHVNDTGATYEIKCRHESGLWGLYQRLDDRERAVAFIEELEADLAWDRRLREMLGIIGGTNDLES